MFSVGINKKILQERTELLMLAARGKGTIMTNLTNNNVNVTINGSNIEISGNGTLNWEDISRINFELATVTIKGFSYIDHSVSYCFEYAF